MVPQDAGDAARMFASAVPSGQPRTPQPRVDELSNAVTVDARRPQAPAHALPGRAVALRWRRMPRL